MPGESLRARAGVPPPGAREDLDLAGWMDDAANSLRIVLDADESIRTRRAAGL
jgi:hypothetical protein